MLMSDIDITLVEVRPILNSDRDLISDVAQMRAFLLLVIAARVGCLIICAESDIEIRAQSMSVLLCL